MIVQTEKILLRLIESICLVLLVVLAVAVVYSTTMRYLGSSPSWYDEVASVLLAWLLLLLTQEIPKVSCCNNSFSEISAIETL